MIRRSHVSSNAFGVDLQADPLGRQIVQVSGIALLLIGLAVIQFLPLAGSWRIVLLVIWLADCAWSQHRLRRAFARVRWLRLDSAGCFSVTGPDDSVTPTGMVTGSVVCRRCAWLRFRLPDGSRHAELLTATRATTLDWHRFQLIWRLCKQTFGHPGRA